MQILAKTASLVAVLAAGLALAEEAPAPLPTIAVQPLPEEAAVQLEQVKVSGTRIKPKPAPATATGLDGATHTQPLSVVSLSRQELEARGARDLNQALESMASVSAPSSAYINPYNYYDARGFEATVLFDGFSHFTLYGNRDSLAGVERIDVVKGPGSALNGGALGLPPGGVIDIHSRWPGEQRQAQLAIARSRYHQQSLLVEFDTDKLLPVVSFGLAAERSQGAALFDFSTLNNQKLRPSLSLRGLGGRLSFYYEDSRRTAKDHPGLPTTGTLDTRRFTTPDTRSVNDPDVPLSHNDLRTWGFDGTLPVTGWLTLEAAARKGLSRSAEDSQYISSNTPDTDPSGQLAPSTFNRMAATHAVRNLETQARLRLTARHNAGRFGRLTGWLGGGGDEVANYVEMRVGVAQPLDLANPSYGNWSGTPVPFAVADSRFSVRNASTGLQWRLGGWLNAFAALTRTHGEVGNRQTVVAAQVVRDLLGEQAQAIAEGLLFPVLAAGPAAGSGLFVQRQDRYQLNARQFGVAARLWDAGSRVEDDGLWLFYGEGNGHHFQAYFGGEGQPRPGLSQQQEAGARLVHRRWGRIETAAFRIQRRNVPTIDPNGVTGFEQVTTGLQSVRGLDVEATLTPPHTLVNRFSLNASAAWLKGRIDEDTNFASGNTLPDVPARSWRVQLAAEALRAPTPLRLFVARRCRTAVAGDLANSFTVPGRCLNDAGATASWRGYTLDATVNNFSDERYFEPYTYLFFGVIPGERRTARLSLGYAFGNTH